MRRVAEISKSKHSDILYVWTCTHRHSCTHKNVVPFLGKTNKTFEFSPS